MVVNECPCRYCVAPKRHSGCHAQCGEYKKWTAARTQANDIIRENREAERAFESLAIRRHSGRRKH